MRISSESVSDVSILSGVSVHHSMRAKISRQCSVEKVRSSAVRSDDASDGRTRYSSRISTAESIHFASHFAIKRLHPRLVSLNISPGTAKTSFPCSSANHAVMRVPLFSQASGITTPSESHEIISFLIGNM